MCPIVARVSLNPALEDVRFCPRCAAEAQVDFPRSLRCPACGFRAFYNPKPVAAVIPRDEGGRVWLLRRGFDPGLGRWTFPGGFVDLGESVEEAARREVREELAIEVELGPLLGVYSSSEDRIVLVVFLGTALAAPQTTPEATEVRAFAGRRGAVGRARILVDRTRTAGRARRACDRMGAVSDDFRVTVDLLDEGPVADFVDRVRAVDVESSVRERLGDRVVVSHDADNIFFYADTEEAAREVERLVEPLLAEHGLDKAHVKVTRWHPAEEEWRPAEEPLPEDPAALARERERFEAREVAEAQERGWTDFEVRAELPSHRDTVAFARRLEQEGLPVVRRWKFLIVGAATQSEAEALAARLRDEAPDGTRVMAEGSGALAWRAGDGGGLAFLGGLGN